MQLLAIMLLFPSDKTTQQYIKWPSYNKINNNSQSHYLYIMTTLAFGTLSLCCWLYLWTCNGVFLHCGIAS